MPAPDPTPTEPAFCFDCDGPTRIEWHDYTFAYGVDDAAVPLTARIPVEVCTRCGAGTRGYDSEVIMHEAVCRHHGVLSPGEIQELREAHGLSRKGFAALSGLSTASLGRWEKGILIQSQANDRYLRLLQSPDNVWALRQLANEPRGADFQVLAFEDSPGTSQRSMNGARPEFRHVADMRSLVENQPAFQVRAA